MRTNQADEEVVEEELFQPWSQGITDVFRDEAIRLILDHLKLKAVYTNATKHGAYEVELRPVEGV